MFKFKNIFSFCLTLLICLTVISCTNENESILLSQAMEIRTAINNKDVDSLAKLVGSSLSIREQHWQVTENNMDLVLITKSDSKISTLPSKQKGLQLLASTLFIQSEKARVASNSKNLFNRELQGIEHNWNGLDIVEFDQQQKGSEHIILLGFDPKTKKLLAVYSN